MTDRSANAVSLAPLVLPRLSLAANLLLVALLALVSVMVANRLLFPMNWWVNPGPIVIGLCIKCVLASRSVRHISPPAATAARSLARLDLVALVVLLGATVVYLVMYAH